MSHKENDKYFEALSEAQEELNYSLKQWEQSKKETQDALDWEAKMARNYLNAKQVLDNLKNKEF